MATRKNTTKRKEQNQSGVLTKNNILIGIIVLLAISYVFLWSEQTGIIGKTVRTGYFTLFGSFAFVIPLYIIGILVLEILHRLQGRVRSVALQIGVLLLFGMALIAIYTPGFTDFASKIENGRFLATYKMGTGLLGSSIGWVLWRLLGKVGSTILVLLYTMVLLMLWLSLSVRDIAFVLHRLTQTAINKTKSWYANRKKKEIQAPDPIEPTETQPVSTDSHETNSFPLIDYSDAETTGDQYPAFSVRSEEEYEPKQMEIKDLGTKHQIITNYEFPSVDLLQEHRSSSSPEEKKLIRIKADKIEKTLANFGIEAKVTHVNRGPTVTCFEMEPAPGVKVSRIVSLVDDLALNLATQDIRIIAPLPGKAAVGLEIPNETKDIVSLREIIASSEFAKTSAKLPFALGKTITGKPIVSAIEKMPHLLIAGSTGSGKSVCINSIIMSILYHARPDEVKLVLIDPKVVELSVYNGIPHLIVPVVTQPKKASAAMFWAVEEMERRYQLFSSHRVRDIGSYKEKASMDPDMENLPYIVVIIDELADLMMVAASEVENYIARLAQMARACGIHLIVATQRPSVDVITGTIKANIPSRISFQVSSQIDSRTILDMAGAEKLLGKGDLLFYPSGFSKPLRVQGAFVSEAEVERVVEAIKCENQAQRYDAEVLEMIEEHGATENREISDQDPLLIDAIDIVIQEGQAAVSLLQRKLRIGYARAGRLIDDMENLGIIGKHEGSKSRKVLIAFNPLKEENHEFS